VLGIRKTTWKNTRNNRRAVVEVARRGSVCERSVGGCACSVGETRRLRDLLGETRQGTLLGETRQGRCLRPFFHDLLLASACVARDAIILPTPT
jgi:hypothetical protein